jgi:hypothetical protein
MIMRKTDPDATRARVHIPVEAGDQQAWHLRSEWADPELWGLCIIGVLLLLATN